MDNVIHFHDDRVYKKCAKLLQKQGVTSFPELAPNDSVTLSTQYTDDGIVTAEIMLLSFPFDVYILLYIEYDDDGAPIKVRKSQQFGIIAKEP